MFLFVFLASFCTDLVGYQPQKHLFISLLLARSSFGQEIMNFAKIPSLLYRQLERILVFSVVVLDIIFYRRPLSGFLADFVMT